MLICTIFQFREVERNLRYPQPYMGTVSLQLPKCHPAKAKQSSVRDPNWWVVNPHHICGHHHSLFMSQLLIHHHLKSRHFCRMPTTCHANPHNLIAIPNRTPSPLLIFRQVEFILNALLRYRCPSVWPSVCLSVRFRGKTIFSVPN